MCQEAGLLAADGIQLASLHETLFVERVFRRHLICLPAPRRLMFEAPDVAQVDLDTVFADVAWCGHRRCSRLGGASSTMQALRFHSERTAMGETAALSRRSLHVNEPARATLSLHKCHRRTGTMTFREPTQPSGAAEGGWRAHFVGCVRFVSVVIGIVSSHVCSIQVGVGSCLETNCCIRLRSHYCCIVSQHLVNTCLVQWLPQSA